MEAAMIRDIVDKSRVDKASDRITQHIVDRSVVAEEEESPHKKSRQAHASEPASSSLKHGWIEASNQPKDQDQPKAQKRRAEDEADDAARGDHEELPDDAPTSLRAAILGKGSKRPADEEADDRERGEREEDGD